MIIRKSNFKEKEEIDFHASFHYRGRYGRVSVRLASVRMEEQDAYQIAVTLTFETIINWHHDKSEEVVMSGSLQQCVRLANLLTGTEDEVQE